MFITFEVIDYNNFIGQQNMLTHLLNVFLNYRNEVSLNKNEHESFNCNSLDISTSAFALIFDKSRRKKEHVNITGN